jgi:D-alanyl-lipoteichoic acid acyltransferase DltB (MBOAT superfamily)
MHFHSLGYIAFLLIAIPVFWLLPERMRIWFLGAMSVLFYSMWRWEFALLILFSATVDYYASKRIHRATERRHRLPWLIFSLGTNLGLLVFFKYTYFVLDNMIFLGLIGGDGITSSRNLGFSIILPLGVSFYTFQTISYTIDVYRGAIRPTKRFISFFVYVIFWPQLIAGPIVRAGEMLPQLREPKKFNLNDLETGLIWVICGLFKKTVLADNLSILVDGAFAEKTVLLNATDVWVAAFLFGFQIYFDFSGYSDIAIGSARMVGLRLTKNFNWPYMSISPKMFWKNWHISLSSWVRDYLYLPLTGQKSEIQDPKHGRHRGPAQPLFDKRYLRTIRYMVSDGPVARCRMELRVLGHIPCVFHMPLQTRNTASNYREACSRIILGNNASGCHGRLDQFQVPDSVAGICNVREGLYRIRIQLSPASTEQ